MFNSTNITSPSTVRVFSDTQEHRAPTDESVKLLREMEDAAMKRIIAAIKADNNDIKFDWITAFSRESGEPESTLIMVINGKRIEEKFCEHEFQFRSAQDAARIIIERVSKAVADKVLRGLFDDSKNFRQIFERK